MNSNNFISSFKYIYYLIFLLIFIPNVMLAQKSIKYDYDFIALPKDSIIKLANFDIKNGRVRLFYIPYSGYRCLRLTPYQSKYIMTKFHTNIDYQKCDADSFPEAFDNYNEYNNVVSGYLDTINEKKWNDEFNILITKYFHENISSRKKKWRECDIDKLRMRSR